MKKFTSDTQKTGEIGENIAVEFLRRRDFRIIERNYTRKWGEIDVVALEGRKLHFIEVKTVSRESFQPLEQVHNAKQARIVRTIETYLGESSAEWQFDVLCVFLNKTTRFARVMPYWDIILSENR